MPSPINLPKVFNTDDPARLKSDLERLVQETERYFRSLDDKYTIDPTAGKLNDPTLAIGRMTLVSLSNGQTGIFSLPPPDVKNIGKVCIVARLSTLGDAFVVANGQGILVNGSVRYKLPAELHFVEFLYNGSGWVASRTGGGS